MYILISIGLLGIALLIRFVIRPAVRNANAASDRSRFHNYVATMPIPFGLLPDERVTASVLIQELGAIRKVSGQSETQDTYPGSFPLVYSTSKRLAVLMATNDQPTSIVGRYPAAQPNLHFRIGEQFGTGSRTVSSSSWRWETIGMIVAEGNQVGLTWTDREGVGVVLLGFLGEGDAVTFANQALSLIDACRTSAGMAPATSKLTPQGAQSSVTFDNPVVMCASCGSTIVDGDRFCVGCGAGVARREHA